MSYVQRAGQRKKCASCHIVIHTGCMARLDQVRCRRVISVSVILHLRDERTNGRTDKETSLSVRPSVLSFVCLFVRCVCQGRPSYGVGGNEPR